MVATIVAQQEDYRQSLKRQAEFLSEGGVLRAPLESKRRRGELPPDDEYVFHEYPKMIIMGTVEARQPDGKIKEVPNEVIVNNALEEDRVRQGGKSDEQLDEERLDLVTRAKTMGVYVDPAWSMDRIVKEMERDRVRVISTVAADPNAALKAEAAAAEAILLQAKLAEAQAEIALLKARAEQREAKVDAKAKQGAVPVNLLENIVAPIDEDDDDELMKELRGEATKLGIEIDPEWSLNDIEAHIQRAHLRARK